MKSIQIFGANFEERVTHAINALKVGKGVLLVDDYDREMKVT